MADTDRPGLGLGSQELSLRMRDATKALVGSQVEQLRPSARRYTVWDVQYDTRQARCYQPDDDPTIDSQLATFPFYTDFPPATGDLVMVEGPSTGGYITNILNRSRGVYLPSITNFPFRLQQTMLFEQAPFYTAPTTLVMAGTIKVGFVGTNLTSPGDLYITQPVAGVTPVVAHNGTTDPLVATNFFSDPSTLSVPNYGALTGLAVCCVLDDASLWWEPNPRPASSSDAGTWHLVNDTASPFAIPSSWLLIAASSGSATATKQVRMGNGVTLNEIRQFPFNQTGTANMRDYREDDPQFEWCTYEKDNSGYVCLSGLLRSKGATSYVVPATLGTMPAGYRPKQRLVFMCAVQNSWGRVDVFPDGTVKIQQKSDGSQFAPNDWVNLEGIRYRAYQ